MISSQISCDEDPFQMLSSPLTFSAIDAASMPYRHSTCSTQQSSDMNDLDGIQTLNFSRKESKAPSTFFVPSQVHKSVVPAITQPTAFDDANAIHFTLNTTFPKSKCHQNNSFEEPMDIFQTKSASTDSNTDSVKPHEPGPVQFPFCNSLNSYIVDMARHAILDVLSCILRTFMDDIQFTTDTVQCRINGMVFVSQRVVYFVLYIHEDTDKDMDTTRSTVEYRRSSGDAMASATFWNYIQQQMESRIAGNVNCVNSKDTEMDVDSQCTIEFDPFNLNFVPDKEMNVDSVYGTDSEFDVDIGNKVYLDQIIVSMEQNDQYLMDELRILYQQVSVSMTLPADMLRHESFIKVLMDKAMLHNDVCIARFAILILQQICNVEKGCMYLVGDSENFNVFGNINKMLDSHGETLVTKHAIRFVGKLTMASSWNMEDMNKNQLQRRMKQYGEDYGDDKEIYPLIQRINKKLSGL